MKTFSEDSRVKIPAILHLMRLGYQYIPRKNRVYREDINIFPEIFFESVGKLNPDMSADELKRLLEDIRFKLDYDDLGKTFYEDLINPSGPRLIDFDDFSNNSFHVTTELTYKNGDEEFRPDITVLINGMPLVFIEVKKPNNKEGMRQERKRMNIRFGNRYFKHFANLTQLMIFSNNMEYEEGTTEPLYGAFYATSAYSDLHFNYFREEDNLNLTQLLLPEKEQGEDDVLTDNHFTSLKHLKEFQENKHYNTPTHRLLTSLLNRDRLAFLLRYGITYVTEKSGGQTVIQKHIMRYPQLFATKAIERKLNEGVQKGIIWHTQGSGKTALAYYNVRHLTDYYRKQNVIPKFYFIVDRIDLADQSAREFTNRGLHVNRVNSRAEFTEDIRKLSALHNDSGKMEISVVNIQKFSEEATVLDELPYDLHIQRVYFLDEAHRSYNPKGNYLANLINSDKKAIKIALTGTPLLREVVKDYDSKALFGDYIHKYYYNQSIADGYTLRLIREGIDSNYAVRMKEILDHVEVLQGELKKSMVYAHPKYVEPLLEYIADDLIRFRNIENDASLGGMVVCDSSEQAKALFHYFEQRFGQQATSFTKMANVAQYEEPELALKRPLTAAIILHDVNDKSTQRQQIEAFKKGEIDVLFVYNMLLTGFDAKRLKKLYLTRVIKDHNLLQTLTRVNRPYKNYKYGYVVDFADITSAFDKTNRMYFDELQEVLGNDIEGYSKLFLSPEEMQEKIEHIRETLFRYDSENVEVFERQIEEVHDKESLQQLVKALTDAKELRNIMRLSGNDELLKQLDFTRLGWMLNVAQAQLDKLNLHDAMHDEQHTASLLNQALEEVLFLFVKVSEEELILADQLKNQLRQTREEFLRNFDPKDPRFISLKEELERIFRNKNLNEVEQDGMRENISLLKNIYTRIRELNRQNGLLKSKYGEDERYARLHKRIQEKQLLSVRELQLFEALQSIKAKTDDQVLKNARMIENEAYFTQYLLGLVVREIVDDKKINMEFTTAQAINRLIVQEYLQQYHQGTL